MLSLIFKLTTNLYYKYAKIDRKFYHEVINPT